MAEVIIDMPERLRVGVEKEFSVSIVDVGAEAGTMVVGKGVFPAEGDYTVWYKENDAWVEFTEKQDPDQYFGPSSGFPLMEATSYFKVKFNAPMTATFTVQMMDAETKSKVICEGSAIVNVLNPETAEEFNERIKEGGEVALENDITGDIIITKDVTIDLAGFTLTNVADHTITVKPKVNAVIGDSVGTAKVDSVVNGKASLFVEPRGNASIYGGRFERSAEDSSTNTWYTIQNQGNVSIDGPDADIAGKSTLTSCIENGFDTAREADKEAFESVGDPDYNAILLVRDGLVASNKIAIKNDEHGTCSISGGKVRCTQNPITNWGKLGILGGTVTTAGSPTAILNGAYNGSVGYVSISGGTINAVGAGDAPIIDTIDGYEAGAKCFISGGTFSKAPPQEYLMPGFVFITDSSGKTVAVDGRWQYPERGPQGGAFNGYKRFIIHKDIYEYETGGITAPLGFKPVAVVSASAKGGVVPYVTQERKIILYTLDGKEASGNIEDLTIVMIGN